MLRAEMQEILGALDDQAEQTWTSHQVMLLNKTNRVAGDPLENQRRSLLSEATAQLQRHQRQNHERQQE